MSRGNQREIDRQRAASRHAGKGKKSEGVPEKKREQDGNALKAKLEAKAAREAAEKDMEEAKAAFEAEKRAAQGNNVGGKVGFSSDAESSGSPSASASAAAKSTNTKSPEKKKKPKEDLSFLTELARGGKN